MNKINEKDFNQEILTVPISKIKRIISIVEEEVGKDAEVGMDFIIGSFFPGAWENMINIIKHQYTLGYLQGKEESSKFENQENL